MADHLLDRYEGLGLPDQVVIDRLCSCYEMALRAGERPSLEEYLQKANVSDRACLLAELVALERTYRGGEGHSRDDYVARFPGFADAIDEAFRTVTVTRLGSPSRSPQQVTVTPPVIDGYEVLGELGRGGMGVVFQARHLRLKRPVALKVILQGELASEQHRARFLVETEMLGRLRHPNVVQVFEAGQQGGRPFLALEYVEGGSLAQRLANGPLAPREAVALVGQLARAIHHAHSQGVIHRDLKPGNVLLSADGTPKVTDFGLACQPGGGEHSQTGLVLGTPGYMPPEQARGERQSLGPAADVYSLGAVLYETLTGRPPFRAATPLETIRLVLENEPEPPGCLRPGLDADLSTVCLKCLRKEPEGRYASAEALADDLDRWLKGEPIAARPAGRTERAWKWARRKPTQAGLLAVSLLFVLAVIVIPTVAALQLRHEQTQTRLANEARQRADEGRRLALVQSLQAAAPESVPFLVDDLAAAPEQVLPLLRKQFNDPKSRFRAAVVLTLLGDDRSEYLLTTIPERTATDSANLARAFRASKDPRLADELHRRGLDGRDSLRVRHAILLLDLGDVRLARSLLTTADPNPRSTFLEEVHMWHGDLAAWPAIIDAAEHDDLRAVLCAAVGRVDRTKLDEQVCRSLVAALSRQYQHAPDPGTHAAAEWSLHQWKEPLPPLAEPKGERRWFVNRAGMTMMAIPPGVLRHIPASGSQHWPHEVTAAIRSVGGVFTVLPRPYYVSDREVTLGLFRRFMTLAAQPPTWPVLPELDLPSDHPAPVNRLDQVAPFCNWLSIQEGRRKCYDSDQSMPPKWTCDYTADGYRLPTEGEWEHAQRAGSSTRYFFGDDAGWLPIYGHVATDRTGPCGKKLPNRWGLFDVVGNLWEATGDGVATGDGPTQPTRAIRGGGFDSGSTECQVMTRGEVRPDRLMHVGFRVVCGSAKDTRELMSDPRDKRAISEYLVHGAGENVGLIQLRGDLRGYFGKWREATADYVQVVERAPPHYEDWTTAAALFAQMGDLARYRALRRRLLEDLGPIDDPLIAERIAKACLLLPGGDLDPVFRLVTTAVDKGNQPWAIPYAELAQGMAEYRRGDHAAARKSLERCVQDDRQPMSPDCQALRGFFLAMAQYRLGKHDEAAKTYEQAQALLGKLVEALKRGHENWRDVVRATIAEAEAKKLLESRK